MKNCDTCGAQTPKKRCQKCTLQKNREYRLANKERIAENKKQYAKDNRIILIEANKKYLFGLEKNETAFGLRKKAISEYNKKYYASKKL